MTSPAAEEATPSGEGDSSTASPVAMLLRALGALVAIAVVVAVVWRWRVNGWGSLVWLASAFAVPIIRAPFARQNATNTIVERRTEGQERILLAIVGIGAGVIPLVHLATGLFGFADYDLPDWATAIGVVMMIVGLWMFHRTHVDLGRNWSVTLEVRDEHTLTTTGIYSKIRHPMYTSLFVTYLATPLLVHNWIAGFVGVVSFTVMYVLRVPHEERMMDELFGEQYDTYRRRTGRLLPRLGG
ncbi:MAG: protein-S-isoprenylcysteine O-methyltransferase [Actinomycetota bacterium]